MSRKSAALVAFALALLGAGAAVSAEEKEKDTRPVVVHVGDSFLGSGFMQALKPKFNDLKIKYVSNSQTSAYTTTLNRQVKLDSLITVHKPKLVILTIGANEMAMPLPETHAHAVKGLTKIVSASSACIWALPPRWGNNETGILGIMKREASPCRVHDPSAIEKDIPRASDKIHPSNPKGGQMWADHFWSWMMEGKTEGQLPWDGMPQGTGSAAPSASAAPPASSSK